jgi:hypothetical protein
MSFPKVWGFFFLEGGGEGLVMREAKRNTYFNLVLFNFRANCILF